uniref:RNase H type-1 domain-containing protein n=1 Tax=Cannabis sativa TaxID=3483 RepID=A0A803NRM0_CANSA
MEWNVSTSEARAGLDMDSLLYNASKESCARFREIMGWYERASGQLVNLSKSSVCFSLGCLSRSQNFTDFVLVSGGVRMMIIRRCIGVPGRDYVGTIETSKASYIWKSTIWGRELLEDGTCWLIDYGINVSIKSQILSIPRSHYSQDRLIWHYNSSGLRGTDRHMGYGAVVRDQWANCLAFTIVPARGSLSSPVEEAMTVLHGLLCSRLGFNNVEVKSDCQRVIQILQKRDLVLAEFDLIFKDIHTLCNDVNVSKFFFFNHSGNCLAHNLDKITLSLDMTKVW